MTTPVAASSVAAIDRAALEQRVADLSLYSESGDAVADGEIWHVPETAAVFGKDGFTFHDVLDAINPLHHLPVIGPLYRAVTEDDIAAAPRVVGAVEQRGVARCRTRPDDHLRHAGRDERVAPSIARSRAPVGRPRIVVSHVAPEERAPSDQEGGVAKCSSDHETASLRCDAGIDAGHAFADERRVAADAVRRSAELPAARLPKMANTSATPDEIR